MWVGQESANSITNNHEIDEEFESLLTQLRENDEITVEDFVTFDDNLTISTGQSNTDLTDWDNNLERKLLQRLHQIRPVPVKL